MILEHLQSPMYIGKQNEGSCFSGKQIFLKKISFLFIPPNPKNIQTKYMLSLPPIYFVTNMNYILTIWDISHLFQENNVAINM